MYYDISIKTLDKLVDQGLILEYRINHIEGVYVWITIVYTIGTLKYFLRFDDVPLIGLDYERVREMVIRNMVDNYRESLYHKVE